MDTPTAVSALNTFISFADVRDADAEPVDGPLAGLTFAVKDNIDVVGFPTTAGTPALENHVPTRDADLVARVRDRGATPVGKTNMHELSLGVTSNNARFGPVRNPHDTDRVAGGSSGGSAVACAQRIVDFALGTDTGGSVRLPAAHCGVYGFRPSSGRYPADGIIGLSSTRDTAGVLSAALETIVLVDTVITDESELPEPREQLRLGLPSSAWHGIDSSVRSACEAELDRLSECGYAVTPIETDELFGELSTLADALMPWEAPIQIRAYLHSASSPVSYDDVVTHAASPDVRAFFKYVGAAPITADEYEAARQRIRELAPSHLALFVEHDIDALLYPTVPFPAPKIGEDRVVVNGESRSVFRGSIRNLEASTATGTPSISVPLSGSPLPVGLTWEAARHADRLLLSMVGKTYT